jgi:hypothetical protein
MDPEQPTWTAVPAYSIRAASAKTRERQQGTSPETRTSRVFFFEDLLQTMRSPLDLSR